MPVAMHLRLVKHTPCGRRQPVSPLTGPHGAEQRTRLHGKDEDGCRDPQVIAGSVYHPTNSPGYQLGRQEYPLITVPHSSLVVER